MFEARDDPVRGVGARAARRGRAGPLGRHARSCAAEIAHINGTVTDEGGDPLEDIEVAVYLYDADAEFWNAVDFAYTDSLGNYDVAGLAPGTYRVGFYDYASTYAEEFWNDALAVDVANNIVVTDGATVPDIDAELAAFSHIKGKVTGPGGGGLWDVRVAAYKYDAELDEWQYWYDVYTTALGNYDLEGLTAGTYRLQFYDDS